MSDNALTLEDKLARLEQGLFFMSKDRERALSNHETEDLVEELRGLVAEVKAEVNKA